MEIYDIMSFLMVKLKIGALSIKHQLRFTYNL